MVFNRHKAYAWRQDRCSRRSGNHQMSAFSLHLSPLMSSGAAYAKVPKASSSAMWDAMHHMRQPHVRHLRCSLPVGRQLTPSHGACKSPDCHALPRPDTPP